MWLTLLRAASRVHLYLHRFVDILLLKRGLTSVLHLLQRVFQYQLLHPVVFLGAIDADIYGFNYSRARIY